MIHIGKYIRNIALKKGVTAEELAQSISCSRKHIYKIYQKYQVDTGLLLSLSKALQHDFFAEYSKPRQADSLMRVWIADLYNSSWKTRLPGRVLRQPS